MVAQLTLDQLVKVRILVPQYFDSFALRFHEGLARSVQVVRYDGRIEANHPEQVSQKGERVEG